MKNFLEDYRKELHRSACELLLTGMPDVTEELFAEFECTGSRLNYERIYFTRRKYLAILGMEAILETRRGRAGRKGYQEESVVEAVGICNGKAGGKNRPENSGNTKDLERKKGTDNSDVRKDVIKKLCDVVESVCAEETWALPAHVNRRVPGWQVTVDLFASETAQTLANLMDELMDELPGTLICRVREEICRRVLYPFFSAKVPYSWWEGSEMNWNAVCAGAIGSVCIHFYRRGLELPVEFSACIRRVCRSLAHYIDGFSEDGVCMEGLGYYTYGMAYYVNFMREMEEVFKTAESGDGGLSGELFPDRSGLELLKPAGTESSVPEAAARTRSVEQSAFISGGTREAGMGVCDEKFRAKLRRIAEFPGKCFFSDGRSVSFSDGDSRDTWRVGIWCGLDAWFDDLPLPSLKSAAGVHADSCYRFVNLKMDVFETEKYLNRADEKAYFEKCGSAGIGTDGVKIFSTAQWCIAESANGVGFACKGGHNDEPHNHNDIGHFIYESDGTVFLADLGAGEYTADYFGANRYQILCNSSAGHSVPVLNGENQKNGREYQCGGFTAYAGETYGESLYVKMDIGSAWQQKEGGPAAAASVQRTFYFDQRTGELKIEDVFDRAQWSLVTETLITQIPPQIEEPKVYLRGNKGMAVISVREEKAGAEKPQVRVLEIEHKNHAGKAEKVYAICWNVREYQAHICLQYVAK